MKKVLLLLAGVAIVIALVGVNQFITLRKAHSNFANYYSFRGCTKLLQKTDTAATCALSSGKVIKLVEVNEKWYLSGDLSVCYFTICL